MWCGAIILVCGRVGEEGRGERGEGRGERGEGRGRGERGEGRGERGEGEKGEGERGEERGERASGGVYHKPSMCLCSSAFHRWQPSTLDADLIWRYKIRCWSSSPALMLWENSIVEAII